MLKLGHIAFSNCFPPHSGIITGAVPFPFKLIEGIPTQLNRFLAEGAIDVSPSSSIEYAMHPGKYLIMPGLSITSRTSVRSIILESRVPIDQLDGKTVALTSASATSVVLLQILLELQRKMAPEYTMYEQGVENPSKGVDAILTIGDLAMTKPASPLFPYRYDLGELWHQFTGLPFVFALWQVNYRKSAAHDLKALYDILRASKEYGLSHLPELSKSYAGKFGIAEEMLLSYWSAFSYDFQDDEKKGLLTFYGYAAEIGAVETVERLRIWEA